MTPFNQPYITGKELFYISEAHRRGQLAGDGAFTELCSKWLEDKTGAPRVLLTHSCTAALEMTAILSSLRPGDEVIMPSFTFVSTANAFAARGIVPVFIDIRVDTLNLDERLIESAITDRTRAIVVVHYAGVSCEMDTIMEIAKANSLMVIEDAAHGIMASYKGRPLGSLGHMGTYSFHETKNITCGEGGALLINDESLIKRAEVIREKGTNRREFMNGAVDKYTWVDVGSSYLPGELSAAFLWGQLEEAEIITSRRLDLWNSYHLAFKDLEVKGRLRRPVIPVDCIHNGHMYYILLRDLADREAFIDSMRKIGIFCVFHYVPLHSSPAGLKYSRVVGDMSITNSITTQLVRLPLWLGMEIDLEKIISYFYSH